MNYISLVVVFAGLFAVVCAAMDFDWFMEHRKARLIVKLFTRNGARIFYVIAGLLLSAVGVLLFLGIIT